MRTTKLIIILGYNGTGKTTLLKQLVNKETNAGRRSLIVTPDDMEWQELSYIDITNKSKLEEYKGKSYKTIFLDDYTLPHIKKNYRNGLLVFDDCRAYFKSTVDRELHNLLIRRRQNMQDIIAVGHGFTEVPPKFFTFASYIILFKTVDNIKRRKDVIRDFDRVEQIQKEVNQQAISNPHFYKIIKF
jgi:AAA15 family ATPase/GTPase